MNKLTLALSALAVTVVASGAQAAIADRISTAELNTLQVKELIQDRGAALLDTGAGHYDRYVASKAECLIGEEIERAYVPTADSASAFVGYVCVDDSANN